MGKKSKRAGRETAKEIERVGRGIKRAFKIADGHIINLHGVPSQLQLDTLMDALRAAGVQNTTLLWGMDVTQLEPSQLVAELAEKRLPDSALPGVAALAHSLGFGLFPLPDPKRAKVMADLLVMAAHGWPFIELEKIEEDIAVLHVMHGGGQAHMYFVGDASDREGDNTLEAIGRRELYDQAAAQRFTAYDADWLYQALAWQFGVVNLELPPCENESRLASVLRVGVAAAMQGWHNENFTGVVR